MKFKQISVKIAWIFVIFAIVITTVWDFTAQMQNALTRDTYKTLLEVSSDYNKAFLDRIAYSTRTMKVLAGGLQAMQGRSKQDVVEILENATREGMFTSIAVCDMGGRTCSNTGVVGNVAHREYFQKAIAGEANVSQPLKANGSGQNVIVIAVPICHDEAVVGALLGVYPLAVAGEQLLDFEYYSDGYGFVVSPDGMIVLSSEHSDKLCTEENIITFFEKTKFENYTHKELVSAMKNGESGNFAFTYNGARRFVSFTPTTVNDWYTFSLSSDAVMLQQKKMTAQIVAILVFRLAIASILLIIFVAIRNKKHNNQIRSANQKYQSLLAHINGGMVVAKHALTVDETIITYVSPGFTDMTGYTIEDIQTMYDGRYLGVILDEDRTEVFNIYLEQLKVGNTYRMPYRIRKKDGSILWVMDNGYMVDDESGLHNHSMISDISAIKQQEQALRMSENRFSVAINASSGTLFEVDLKRQLYTHFENPQRIFGVDAEKLLADTAEFAKLSHDEFVDAVTEYFFHPDDRALTKKVMQDLIASGVASYEARMRRFDNSYIWARVDLSMTVDERGLPSRMIGFMSDIDDIKKQAELLEGKVQTDPLTGLYNKIAMSTLANKVLEEYPDGRHALMVLDIDSFKGINDTLGHAFGDLVLVKVSNQLKTAFRNNDVVGRIGGDEFAVLMKNVPDVSSVLKKATELAGAFRQTYAGEKNSYKISCSIGIILTEKGNDRFDNLYRKADAALYKAKQNGKDQFVLYREEDAESYPIESSRTNDEELKNFKTSHNMEAQIFELLYTSQDFNVSINMALTAIGQQYHVSRVAIFENSDDGLTISDIYEWCNEGIAPAKSSLQNIPVSSGAESVFDCFDENGLLYCSDVRELPPYLRHILQSKGVISALKVTIADDKKTCGFIGFDDCGEHRIWTSEEIEKLSFLSKVLSVFLFKKKTEDTLLENLHTRLKILDILPDYICVVNPETHMLEYINKKMQELLPQAKPGDFCFSTLHGGNTEPCETCIIEKIKQGNTDNLEIVAADKKTRIKVKAISIYWNKNQKMVLLYGTEKTIE